MLFGMFVIVLGFFQIPFRRTWGKQASETWASLGVKKLVRTPEYWAKAQWLSIAGFWLIGLCFVLSGLLSGE